LTVSCFFDICLFKKRGGASMSAEVSLSAIDIAAYFVELASDINENDLTNLKLQKLLYFAQGKYLSKYDAPLFKEDIEAWFLGPVVRVVYDEYKECGSFPITVFDKKVKYTKNIPTEIKNFLKGIWKEYGKFSASHLVSLTHNGRSAWHKASKGKGDFSVISKELLKNSFEK
jgi:uncharacterized phage-associated protein